MSDIPGGSNHDPQLVNDPARPHDPNTRSKSHEIITPDVLTTLIPKCCVWTMVASGGASILYPYTICELVGANEIVNNYSQYLGTLTEQQVAEYARNLGGLVAQGEQGVVNDITIQGPAARQLERQEPRVNPAPAAVVPEEEEENRNRDWLDWFGTVTRALILFSLIYLNGSLNRLLIVISFYFFMKYYIRYQNEIENNNNANHVRVPAAQDGVNPRERPNTEEEVITDQNTDNQNDLPHPANDSSPLGRFAATVNSLEVFASLVKALFTSLIPNPTLQANADR
ncbi:homocysteine-induced endoplasmic reticulum protein [Brevipalpus obovatus]|uniref:homocysteine-induced endoplasmic reticulum protein n=1 Tax=Brevipalpus obovatus TaxID=246614 RepID=UPI003D9DE8EB